MSSLTAFWHQDLTTHVLAKSFVQLTLRILTKPAADSEQSRPPVPIEADHGFR